MKTNWKKWAEAAAIRAVRTFAESMLAYIGTSAAVLGDVNWIAALSAGALGAVTRCAGSLVGASLGLRAVVALRAARGRAGWARGRAFTFFSPQRWGGAKTGLGPGKKPGE